MTKDFLAQSENDYKYNFDEKGDTGSFLRSMGKSLFSDIFMDDTPPETEHVLKAVEQT